MSSKILVVDDEPDLEILICQKFRKKIQKKELQFIFARDGLEAIEKLQADLEIDMVLTDINMPVMDGLTLLKKLSELQHPTLKTVIFSTYSDLESIRKAMNLGAFDFLTKPMDLEDLEITINKTLAHVQQMKDALEQKYLARQAQEQLLKQQALQESEKRFRALIENSTDMIFILDIDGKVNYSSPSSESIFCEINQHNIGQKIWSWLHPDDRQLAIHIFQKLVQNPLEKQYLSELKIRNCQQDWEIFEAVFTNLLAEDAVGGIVVNCHNITERKKAEEKILHDALHDSLTGLPNRVLFVERLSQTFARYKRHPTENFAVLFIDLDRFKVVNDSLGHSAGDRLLIEAAKRLKDRMRDEDTIARMGGDEFGILLEYVESKENAKNIAQKLQQILQLPFIISDREVYTSASIGIAFCDRDYKSPSEILRDADTAMYHAKALGKARQEVFHTAMYAENLARLQLEIDLRRGIEREEFELYYQPIVSLETDRISGFEALLRWHHPQRGMIPPDKFIPIAEETGLIMPIGKWILQKACQQMQQWQQQFSIAGLKISVNLSGRQFSQVGLVEQVEEILLLTGLDAGSLKLEITETTIMENEKTITKILSQLKSRNVQLNIDDFGTGYSSLSRLRNFPIDTLKIDRSFVSKMELEPENLEIIRAIISMAYSLGMDVIAEGVETAEQLTKLKNLKCKYAQGYFFSKPLDSNLAASFIESERQW